MDFGFRCRNSFLCIYVIYDNLDMFLQRKFKFDDQAAANLSTVFLLVSFFVTAAVSLYIDKTGKRVYAMIFCIVNLSLALFFFHILPGCDKCYTAL